MPSSKDKIFAKPHKVKPFKFDNNVAQAFDDMVLRSIPCYQQVQSQILALIKQLVPHPHVIYDLGCSTGNLLFYLAQNINRDGVKYVGVDSSKSMVAKAKENLKNKKLRGDFCFVCKNIQSLLYQEADVIILNYVLQFFAPQNRLEFLLKIYGSLKKGSVVILSEKTLSPFQHTSEAFVTTYEEFKLNNHYSKLEIAQKRKSLEKILVPFSFAENLEMLQKAGFSEVEPFFTWFNFASYVAVK